MIVNKMGKTFRIRGYPSFFLMSRIPLPDNSILNKNPFIPDEAFQIDPEQAVPFRHQRF